MGAALRPRNSAPIATAAPTDQRQLASGRNLHPGQGQVGLFIPGCRLQRCDDRLPSVGYTRRSSGRALSRQGFGRREPSGAAGHQYRRARRLSTGHRAAQSRGGSEGELPEKTTRPTKTYTFIKFAPEPCPVRSSQLFRCTARKNEVKDLV